MPLPAPQGAADLPAKAGEGLVCASCSMGPDLLKEFEIVRKGNSFQYEFPCRGHPEGCRGSIVIKRDELLELTTLHEAGKARAVLRRLEDAFERSVEDATNASSQPSERASGANAAVAVAKLKLQVAGLLQRPGIPVSIQNRVQIAQFSPDGPVAKEIIALATQRLQKDVREQPDSEPVDVSPEPSEPGEVSLEGLL